MNSYVAVLKKYGVFSRRAQRSEYWMFAIVNSLVVLALTFIAGATGLPLLGVLGIGYSVAVLIPSLAVTVRRLHDTGRSGWWLLVGLVPYVGAIVILIFMLLDSERGESGYGPSPKYGPSEKRMAYDRRQERLEMDRAQQGLPRSIAGELRETSELSRESTAGLTVTCNGCGRESSRHLITCTNCGVPVGYR